MRTLTFEEIKAIDFVDLNNKDYRILVKYDINHYEVNKEYKILYIESYAYDRITICITDGFLDGFYELYNDTYGDDAVVLYYDEIVKTNIL